VSAVETAADVAEASAFLFREARLLDEHDYDAWLALWEDDGVYWVPANGEPVDPTTRASFVYDNRRRLEVRIRQLQTGHRYAQTPRSRTQHYVSNVEAERGEGNALLVRSACLVVEARFGEVHLWPGKALHELVRRGSNDWGIRRKTVTIVNNDQPVTSMAFLL